MMETGVYERGLFGDLMLFAIACGARKVLLIFNTNLNTPHDPIYVCDPRKFAVQPDTDLPVVLAYDMAHYESLHPLTASDTEKTSELVKMYLQGNYQYGRGDIPYLLSTENEVVATAPMSSARTKDSETSNEDRPPGARLFEENLPENLRGKRPKDMNPEEKKMYNNFRAKMSRSKQTKEQSDRKLKKKAASNAKSMGKESEKEIQKETNANCTANKRARETQDKKLNRMKQIQSAKQRNE